MKILLFGEFSGLHTNLKHGLQVLGHDVTLVSTGDGVKQIGGADIYLKTALKNRYLRKLHLWIQCLFILPRMKRYDIVQYIAPYWLPLPLFVQLLYLKWMRRHNQVIFYNACGSDPFLSLNMVTLRYSHLSDAVAEGDYTGICLRLSGVGVQYSLKAYDLYDGIIASTCVYAHAVSRHQNYKGYVPFPSIIPARCLDFPSVEEQVCLFFGYTRTDGKGVRHILEALERIKIQFGERVDVRIVRSVPYAEYLDCFDQCHIFIDQSSSYGYAMNALLGMGKGKVVLSGCEPEVQALLDQPCPIVNILPDAQDIYEKIRDLLEKKDSLAALGRANYEFAKSVHDPVRIAKRYVEKWTNLKEDFEDAK